MSLDRTVSLLKTAAPVVGMVPVIGEQLKSAIEVATQICEIAQVRLCQLWLTSREGPSLLSHIGCQGE
jgi:hypothetical protein